MKRREFSKAVRVEIVKRASTSPSGLGYRRPHCEDGKCGVECAKFEIDHRDPDAMQIDKSRKLTAADGWLLCIPCHSAKTKTDVAKIAKAKRVEAKHLGVKNNTPEIPADPNALKSRKRPKWEGREPLSPRQIYEETPP